MKNRLLYIGLSVISALALNSCKNDLDVLAPGGDAVSVYGVINPNEAVQNIRINKVYITNGDALAAGQDNGTINFGPNELRVTLQRFVNGNLTTATPSSASATEIVLTETVVTTADGNFNTGQRIWQTSTKLYNVGEYKLTITNVSSGKEFTSKTLMIDSVKPYPAMPLNFSANPAPSHFPVHCGVGNAGYIWGTMPGAHTSLTAYVDYSTLTASPSIKFKSVANARLYKVIMRFHYIDSLTDNVTGIRNYVDLNFPTQNSAGLEGGEEMKVTFSAPDFYSNLASQIPPKTVGPIKKRIAHYMEYIIYACGENMNIFLQVNQPSNSIAQDKPNYSNIEGGVGVFASLSRFSIKKELYSNFIDEISNNSATSSLLFEKNYNIICP